MQKLNVLSGVLVLGLISTSSFAQVSAAFPSLIYPRSIASAGLGEQGVASRNALDAMQFNPANLSYANSTQTSFFRNPWNFLGVGRGFPLTSISVAGRLGNAGSVGMEYTDWDLGESAISTPQNPEGGGELFHSYERSLAGGYAVPLGGAFAVGAQVRYAWQPWSFGNTIHHFFFSAGVAYKPAILVNRLSLGLSLMNLSTAIEYESGSTTINGQTEKLDASVPPPSQMNVGLEALALTNEFFDVSVSLGATKPLDKKNGPPDYAAQSSFSSLFNDWTDFPDDVTAQVGLGYLWHPVYLGGGVSFVQEMYVGYFSSGPKDFGYSFYTHGFKVGLKAHGVSATVGYAGRWHNNSTSLFLPWVFPWETFQFGLSTDLTLLGTREAPVSENILHGMILSGGYSYGLVTGKMKESSVNGISVSFSNNTFWSVETDFYTAENTAILASIQYARMTKTLHIGPIPTSFYQSLNGMETFSLESGFRYHPIGTFHPLFIQGSLGVIRLNPVYERTSPRYFYNTFDRLVVGGVVPVSSGVIVMPRVGLTTIFMSELSNANRLGGYNQFEFGVNVGYQL